MASGKYPIFNKSKNPFNKTSRTLPSANKKSSTMFDENNSGIITTSNLYETDYYETVDNLEYYDLEDGSTYYQNLAGTAKNIFSINYAQNNLNK